MSQLYVLKYQLSIPILSYFHFLLPKSHLLLTIKTFEDIINRKKRGDKHIMNERLRKLRKTLDLTQQEFADRIGSKRNTVAKYETNTNTPSAAVISLICREFNVNETWLRTGEGEMFIEVSQEDEYTKAAASIAQNNDVEIMSLLVEYWKLDDTSKEIFKNYLRNVSERIVSAKPNTLTLAKANKIYEECPKTPEELEKLVINKDDKNVC